MNIKESGEQFCYLLQPILINIIEGAEVFAVNIPYGDYLTIPDNRYYNLRTGGAAAGLSLIHILLNIELFGKGYLTNFVFCVIGAIAVLWIWKKLFD